MELKTTVISEYLQQSYEAQKRIIALQGGTRSSKTYNTLIWLIAHALTDWKNKTISVVRQTLPALKATAERDFFEILDALGLYNELHHNKTDRLYKLGSNLFEFFSCDENQKVRGRKRDVLFCNEANELNESTYKQLAFRTKEFVILDYNPSEEEHWIYDKILTDSRTAFYKTTYKDNPFLEPAIVKEIEVLQHTDQHLWQVFGLGERGYSTAKIYTHTQYFENYILGSERILGIDFGFNNPTAVVQVDIKDSEFFVRELLYKDKMTNNDLVSFLSGLGLSRNILIYADSAEPNRIEELRRAGFSVELAQKDVKTGIDFCTAQSIHIHKESVNLQKEIKAYKWKESNGKILDEPVKYLDHALDAMRYAIYTHYINIPQKITFAKNVKNKIPKR
jgi:phage terminase large subunit